MLQISRAHYFPFSLACPSSFNSLATPRNFTFPRYRTHDSTRRLKLTITAIVTDYYSTLNVPREASLSEIKSSYRKLARKYHPDVNKAPGAEDKFKEISAAYEILSDAEKRSSYDRYGSSSLLGSHSDSFPFSYSVDPFDLLDSFFGTSSNFFKGDGFRSSKLRDLDIEYHLNLSFEESVHGGNREIEINCYDVCGICLGKGAKDDSCISTCRTCQGKGLKVTCQRTSIGSFSQVLTCAQCFGKGTTITEHCGKCGGRGKLSLKRMINLVIPPGAFNGAVLRVEGEGNANQNSGVSGNLFVIFHVEEKFGIKRVGLNLYSNITVDYTQAILGAVVKVQTAYGLEDVSIPSGTQHGDVIKMKNMGISDFNCPSIRGDHHFTVLIRIPQSISEKERQLLEEISLLKARVSTPKSSGFLHFLRKRDQRERFASLSIKYSQLRYHSPFCCRISWSMIGFILAFFLLSFLRDHNHK